MPRIAPAAGGSDGGQSVAPREDVSPAIAATAAGLTLYPRLLAVQSRHAARRIVERARRLEPPTGRPILPAPDRMGATRKAGPLEAARGTGSAVIAAPPLAVRAPERPSARELDRQPGTPAGPDRFSPPWTNGGSGTERIDVGQLADQVVRRIDERIIAHRERLGRI
jgi:hypothetical protein